MKFIKPILFIILLVIASQVYSQVPPEPGKAIPATTVKSNVKQKGPGGNKPPDPGGNTPPVQVPLDGGLLLALLAGGSVSALFLKRKNKEKE